MEITPQVIRELLHYEPDTGIFTWRARDQDWFATYRSFRTWNSRYANKRAGRETVTGNGYRRRVISIFKTRIMEHRLAWMHMTDDPLPDTIDHINRDATDNRWCNIRASSSSDNQHNKSMHRSNTSGVNGVSWDKKSKKWRAYGTLDSRRYYLGLFDDINEAACAANSFREASGFDFRHGKHEAPYR